MSENNEETFIKINPDDIGYDAFLRRSFNPLPEITEDDAQVKTPQLAAETIKGNISEESIQKSVENLVQLSGVQSGTSLSISLTNGQQATLESTITDSGNPKRKMLGPVEMTIYQDNPGVAGSRIPDAISLGNYALYQNHDFHRNDTGSYPGTGLTFTSHVRNNSGSTHTIFWIFRWRYVGTVAESPI